MTVSEAVRIGREAFGMVLLIGGPVLLAAVLVGTAVSLVQAVTQVHEQTLSVVPKLIAVVLVLTVAAGWMLEETVSYGRQSFSSISRVTR